MCRQEEPPTGTDTYAVGPGSSQALGLQEPGLQVIVKNGSGTQIKPAAMMVKFTSASGTACTHKWATAVSATAATGTNALANPGQPFASTATSGATASASGLTGTLTVCADTGARYATLANIQNTNFAALNNAGTLTIPSSGSAGGSAPYGSGTCATKF
jgi:hypothetical protein